MSTPATAAAAVTNKSTIKVIAYETSDPEVYAVVFKSIEQTVTKTNTCLQILPDTSGSMQMTMGGAEPPASLFGNHAGSSAPTPMAAPYDPYADMTPGVMGPPALGLTAQHTMAYNPPVSANEEDEEDAPAPLIPTLTAQHTMALPGLTATPTVPYGAPAPPMAFPALTATPTVPYNGPSMLPALQRSYSCGVSATPAYGHDAYGNVPIPPNTRLGAEEAFLNRIFDMYEFIEKEQGVKQELTISPFSDNCQSFSTLDGLSYAQIRQAVKQALQDNQGTNFDNALQEVKKYREKFAAQTDGTGKVFTVFLSDGGHAGGKKTAQQVEAEYAQILDFAIGIGRGQSDFNEQTLRAISKKFLATDDAKVMRDEVAMLAMNLVTNLGKNITVKTIGDASHIFYSNMGLAEDDEGNRVCKASNMSMLMEYYALVNKETGLELSYTLQSGEQVTEVIHFSEENDNLLGDTSYGDQVKFTVETLQKSDKIPKDISEMTNPQSKLAYVKAFKESVQSSPHASAFTGTRVGVYLQHLLFGLDRISLTQDDQALLQMAQNVGANAFRSTSSDSATAYCSPMVPLGLTPSCSSDSSGTPSTLPLMLRATSSSTSATYGSMCLICTDASAHRGAIYNPCGHFRTCNGCTLQWNKTSDKCPYCNGVSTGIILVSLSEEQKKDSWNMKCTTCKKRQIEIVAEECKHVFSCKPCMDRQRAQTGKVCCTVCAGEGIQTEVKKYKKIFM